MVLYAEIMPVMGVIFAAVIYAMKLPLPPGMHTFKYWPILAGSELPMFVVNPYWDESEAYRKSQPNNSIGVNSDATTAIRKNNMPKMVNKKHIKYNTCLHFYLPQNVITNADNMPIVASPINAPNAAVSPRVRVSMILLKDTSIPPTTVSISLIALYISSSTCLASVSVLLISASYDVQL